MQPAALASQVVSACMRVPASSRAAALRWDSGPPSPHWSPCRAGTHKRSTCKTQIHQPPFFWGRRMAWLNARIITPLSWRQLDHNDSHDDLV